MKRHTCRENLISLILGSILCCILFAVLYPLAEKEQAERRETEQEWVMERRAADRAHETEVEEEKLRREQAETKPTEEDLAEMDYWDELSLLAEVVEAEAGNQDLTGRRLVVDVVLNRVESPLFPDTITEVLEQGQQFSTMHNGAVEEAGWHMQEDDYTAVLMEVTGPRLDTEIYFFTAGGYNDSGTPAYIHGDHYFSYLKEVALYGQ